MNTTTRPRVTDETARYLITLYLGDRDHFVTACQVLHWQDTRLHPSTTEDAVRRAVTGRDMPTRYAGRPPVFEGNERWWEVVAQEITARLGRLS